MRGVSLELHNCLGCLKVHFHSLQLTSENAMVSDLTNIVHEMDTTYMHNLTVGINLAHSNSNIFVLRLGFVMAGCKINICLCFWQVLFEQLFALLRVTHGQLTAAFPILFLLRHNLL